MIISNDEDTLMIDLFILILIIVFFFGSRFIFAKETSFNDVLDRDNSVYLRGMMAIIVLFHHISQVAYEGVLFKYFADFGRFPVSMFFFLSGYGLISQYQKKGKDYLEGFFKKRILKILVPYLLANVVFHIFKSISAGRLIGISDLKYYVKNGDTLVPYSWYIIVLIGCYIVFWICARLFGSKGISALNTAVAVAGILWMILGWISLEYKVNGYGIWWFCSVLSFPLGMLVGQKKDAIHKLLTGKNYRYWIWALASTVFFVFTWLHMYSQSFRTLLGLESVISESGATMCLFALNGMLFVAMFLLWGMKVQCKNKVLEFMGEHSLEVYLYQGLPIMLLSEPLKKQPLIFIPVVVLIAVMMGWMARLVFKNFSLRK